MGFCIYSPPCYLDGGNQTNMAPIAQLLLLCVCLLCAKPALSLQFTKTNSYSVTLSGSIETGDTVRFAAYLRQLDAPTPALYLDSPGGSIFEAVRMAVLIKNLYVSTTVLPNRHCASACFFLFLAGTDRTASPANLMQPGAIEQLA